MAWYVARIVKQNGGHAVTFPDAPSVCVADALLEIAVERASQALAWHLDGLRAKGIACPQPTSLAALESSR